MRDRSPQALWETALGQLELQVTRPNFETWLRNTVGLQIEGDKLTIGVPSDFTIEWLRSRMNSLICRTVSQLTGGDITISFQVLGAHQPPSVPSLNGQQPVEERHAPPPELNPHLTFDSFTVVKANRLAHRAARRLAAGTSSYNPLVLYGAPGLGKSHLLHAIGHEAARAGRAVVALTAEAFVDRYGRAVRAGNPHAFNDVFSACELLLLDDLQFLSSRAASQERFFHIFNSLHTSGCQLVVTLESSPDSLTGLSPRLISRLLAGLSIELHTLGLSERLEILKAKASEDQPIPEPILKLIAEQPYQNVRELEGALNRIAAYRDLAGGSTPSLEAARKALNPLRQHRQPTSSEIIQTVCEHFDLSSEQLAGPSRARDITFARHIAMYLLHRHGAHSLNSIGQLFGERDHSTVLNGCRRITREQSTLPQTRTILEELTTALKAAPAA